MNKRGVSLIALIITIIVIIILAAIVMNASTDTVGNAQYAKFAQEFGEYTDQVMLDAANLQAQMGIRGQVINTSQKFYMVANGFKQIESGDPMIQGIVGFTLPVGYWPYSYNPQEPDAYGGALISIFLNGRTVAALDISDETFNAIHNYRQVAYIINDGKITNYTRYGENNPETGEASHEFYGDSNGKEYHFLTSDGNVFTLPGYPVMQTDGSIEYHIDTKDGHYYVVAGNSGLEPGDVNINGDLVCARQPILGSYLNDAWGLTSDGIEVYGFAQKAMQMPLSAVSHPTEK